MKTLHHRQLLLILLILYLAQTTNGQQISQLLKQNIKIRYNNDHYQQQKQLIVSECSPDYEYSQTNEGINRNLGYIPYLMRLDGQGKSEMKTSISICHRSYETLDITWNVTDSYIKSNYTNCNDPLYNQDAVIVYLGNIDSYMGKYLEVEVNSQGTMYGAMISNKNNSCENISSNPLQCHNSGIYYSASLTDYGYQANAQIPLQLITGQQKTYHLKGNFFRIDYSNQHSNKVDYSAWKSTESQQCFHVPSKFADIILI